MTREIVKQFAWNLWCALLGMRCGKCKYRGQPDSGRICQCLIDHEYVWDSRAACPAFERQRGKHDA